MDIATVAGLLMAFAMMAGSLVVMGMEGKGSVNYASFIDQPENLNHLIEELVGLAETARRDGLLALESKAAEIEDPFVALGIQMAVDGTRPEVIEEVMRTEIAAMSARHKEGKKMLELVGR